MSSRRRRPPGRPDGGAQGGHSGQQRWGTQWCQGRRVEGPVLSSLNPGGEAAGPGQSEARRGSQEGEPGGGVGGCPGGRAHTVVAALRPLAKQEVPGALPAGCWPGLPALLGTPSPQARGAGMYPRPGPGLSGPPVPHRSLTHPPRPGTAWGGSFWRKSSWALPVARPGGGLGPGHAGGRARAGLRPRWG